NVQASGHVRVDVHDAAGQLVKVLWDDDLPAEAKILTWRGETDRGGPVAPGVYFIAARTPGEARQVKRLAVIR
ncbi:MAG: FlgD immunoglobulin-like domain containing protein, partial [bacterium]